MTALNDNKLNYLYQNLPQGLLVDSQWLRAHGYSTSLCSQYLSADWLEQPARRVYHRPRTNLQWQHVVISLQTLLAKPLTIGGRTALELQGAAHYLTGNVREVHLYGTAPPPSWLYDLRVGVQFRHHTGKRLFHDDPTPDTARPLDWGEWSLMVSTPERAILEVLDELPNRESFDNADKLMENLPTMSPRRLQALLLNCRSVKVKRLFFFFAERHNHQWLARLDPQSFDLGVGNRVLVAGGKLDQRYRITVPKDLDAVS